VEVVPIRLEVLTHHDERRLHAKVFEIICQRGRIMVSGNPGAVQISVQVAGSMAVGASTVAVRHGHAPLTVRYGE